MGKRATLCIAIFIWIVGVILSLPMLFFYTTYTQNFANGEIRVICYGEFPNIDDNGLSYDEYLWAYLNNRKANLFFYISCMLIWTVYTSNIYMYFMSSILTFWVRAMIIVIACTPPKDVRCLKSSQSYWDWRKSYFT